MTVAGFSLRDAVLPLDAWIVDHMYAPPESVMATLATAVSGGGTLLCLVALIAGVAGVARRYGTRARGFLLRMLPIAPVGATVLLLQEVIARPGPPQQPQTGTYPSGHVAIVTAVAFAAVIVCGALGQAWRRAVLPCAAVVVAMVAVSRMVLAEHWLLDVLAAAVAATGAALVALVLLRVQPPAASA